MFSFPKPKVGPLEFSFSGLKTAILYFLQDSTAQDPDFIEKNRNDLCASIQNTIVSILMDKLRKAVTQTGINRVAVGGGVSANSAVRAALQLEEKEKGWQTFVPRLEYCTDNAAMIGIVGYLKYLEQEFADQNSVATARYPLGEL